MREGEGQANQPYFEIARWECITGVKFFQPPQNRPHLMEEIGFEAQKDPLLYVFVTVFNNNRF